MPDSDCRGALIVVSENGIFASGFVCETSSWDGKSEVRIRCGQGGTKSGVVEACARRILESPLGMDAREVAKQLKREGWYAWASDYEVLFSGSNA